MKFTIEFQVVCLVGATFGATIPTTNDIAAREVETRGITGINCRGSSQCGSLIISAGVTLGGLRGYLNGINPDRWYNDGEHIACVQNSLTEYGFCIFLQGTAGSPGHAILPLVNALLDHGCGLCGSVPYFYVQGLNDATNVGWLTVNTVSKAGCNGLC